MSDLSDYNPAEASASTGTKRKSTAGTSAPKRAKKAQPDPYANAKSSIQTVLASPESFSLPTGDAEVRKFIAEIAEYAKSLEGSVAVAGTSGKAAPPPKTAEQIAAEVDKLAGLINRGISKQMAWKPSCKTGSAKFSFDGVCADGRVFGAMLGLDGPPKFKANKYTKDEFQEKVGEVTKSVRYDMLQLTSDVNVRWNPASGEFKAIVSTMSEPDLSYSPSPPPRASTSKKRKSNGATSAPKRARQSAPDPHANAKQLIRDILAAPDTFNVPSQKQEYRELLVTVAQYAKDLEASVAVADSTGRAAPPPKTHEEIVAEAKRLSKTVKSGLKKQMNWKPTCKEGRAKYSYDGLCTDSRVFGEMLGLDGPPSFKAKKFSPEEFENLVGDIDASARYSNFRLTGDVNVRYDAGTGQFSISGKYGV